ncbi:MAG: hypothetical protein ACREV4_11570 [Gammaproteobacteria bacterium]
MIYFIMCDPRGLCRGVRQGLQLMDIAPTVLSVFGVDVPKDMQGKVIN